MEFCATRVTRVFIAAAFAWLGLAFFAQAAFATHGRVQVVKINQGGDPNATFAFHPVLTQSPGAAPAAADFSLAGGQSSPAYDVGCNADRPGHQDNCAGDWAGGLTLRVTEQPTPGYTLTDITCRYTQSQDDNNAYSAGAPGPGSPVKPAGELSVDLASGTVNLTVMHYNEWVVCYFTNTPAAGTSPGGSSPPGQAGSSPQPQPQAQVSPARVTPGSAKLHGPKDCPTTNAVAATVTGKRIVKVTFYIDNKKVKTLTKPNKGGSWKLSVDMRRIAYGGHRVHAKVEFAKSSGTPSKTLRLQFNRCRAGAVRPQFTG
jgi:hypothetical protein